MLKQKTTIVVGAGASCELGLPSGDLLKKQILTLLERSASNAFGFSDTTMQGAMRMIIASEGGGQAWSVLEPWKAAADKISRGLPFAASIDNFLHSHQDDERVVRLGKLAIAICILRAERSSHFFEATHYLESFSHRPAQSEPSIRGEKLMSTWYTALAQLLFSGITADAIDEAFAKVRFIVFNYDRCLEQFLWMALQAYFDISGEEAAKKLSNVSFLHPYGSLGPLPWRHMASNQLPIGGGDGLDYWPIGDRIRTFTESVKSHLGDRVKNAVSEASTILILGFGYLDQNLQLLRPGAQRQAGRVISTAYRVSPQDQEVMKRAMMALGGQAIDMSFVEVGECRDLFNNYRMALSLL